MKKYVKIDSGMLPEKCVYCNQIYRKSAIKQHVYFCKRRTLVREEAQAELNIIEEKENLIIYSDYLDDLYPIVKCDYCPRKICLVDDEFGGVVGHNIDWRNREPAEIHVCNGLDNIYPNKSVKPTVKKKGGASARNSRDLRDGGKLLGQSRREQGRFGSLPIFDNHSEEANAD